MREGVMLMCAVATDLLDIERLRAGTLTVTKHSVDLRSAVDSCVQQVYSLRVHLRSRPHSATYYSVCVRHN